MSTAAPALPKCPACQSTRRIKAIVVTSHDRATGEWWEREALSCEGCWIVVQEIPGTLRKCAPPNRVTR